MLNNVDGRDYLVDNDSLTRDSAHTLYILGKGLRLNNLVTIKQFKVWILRKHNIAICMFATTKKNEWMNAIDYSMTAVEMQWIILTLILCMIVVWHT